MFLMFRKLEENLNFSSPLSESSDFYNDSDSEVSKWTNFIFSISLYVTLLLVRSL